MAVTFVVNLRRDGTNRPVFARNLNPITGRRTSGALSSYRLGVDRHSRVGGNSIFLALDSRLHGNDKSLF